MFLQMCLMLQLSWPWQIEGLMRSGVLWTPRGLMAGGDVGCSRLAAVSLGPEAGPVALLQCQHCGSGVFGQGVFRGWKCLFGPQSCWGRIFQEAS